MQKGFDQFEICNLEVPRTNFQRSLNVMRGAHQCARWFRFVPTFWFDRVCIDQVIHRIWFARVARQCHGLPKDARALWAHLPDTSVVHLGFFHADGSAEGLQSNVGPTRWSAVRASPCVSSEPCLICTFSRADSRAQRMFQLYCY